MFHTPSIRHNLERVTKPVPAASDTTLTQTLRARSSNVFQFSAWKAPLQRAAGDRLRLHPLARADAGPVHDRRWPSGGSWARAARTAGCTCRRWSTTRYPRAAHRARRGRRRGHRGDLVVDGAAAGRASRWTRPFAWALIRLDGADTAMLHAVDAGRRPDAHRHAGPGALGRRRRSAASATSSASSPDRVEPTATRAGPVGDRADRRRPDHRDPVTMMTTPIHLRYRALRPRRRRAATCAALAEGRLHRPALPGLPQGLRAAARRLPDRGVPTTEEVELPDTRHGHHVLHRQRAVPRPADHAALRGGLRAARRRRHPVPAPDPGLPGRRGADGHAGRGGLAAARAVGHHAGEHRPLPSRPASPTPPSSPTRSHL